MSQNETTVPVTLTIMGKEYKIACADNEKEELIRAALDLDEQMRKIRDAGRVNGADRIAVMAALNLTHELNVYKNQNNLLKQQLSAGLTNMSNKIADVLDNL
ncbi:MAG: cell division protein ZapA [Methylobacter sp.]|nr:MAG: cell division protein ZapA [Methylobacter sp.]PPD03891.1 MAG: cell division protein ZapA [Methylobacter sp.]PPD23272.1 MAG: cell division protein ZapA [Methylobacter sp.]PPD36350.1 MAG: cell division protein ZapA [Methylomonas sp.]